MASDADAAKFLELTRKKYIDQAKWYLNGFWADGAEGEAENIWRFTHKFIELDDKKKTEGCELDEFQAHKFLEYLGETLTVVALRERLRTIDLDCNGKMALLEYLTFKYQKSVKAIVNAPQGGNQKEIEEASAKLQAVQDALRDVQQQLEKQVSVEAEAKRTLDESKKSADASAKAAAESKKAEQEAHRTLEVQKAAEEAVRKAEEELRAALADLERQETTYKNQIATLEAKSSDPNASTVQKSKAINELAQLKGEDPLPLRKAKITQEAAIRKVEKERKAQEAATQKATDAANDASSKASAAEAAAENARQKAAQAEAAAHEAAEQVKRVEAAAKDTEDKCQEAQNYLEEVKKKGGVAFGAIWWMEREIVEAQKYLPKRKQQQK